MADKWSWYKEENKVKLLITLELTGRELQQLSGQSFMPRDEPRKSWTEAEAKQHARIAAERIIKEAAKPSY